MTAPYSSSRFAYEGTETTETSIVRTGGAVDPNGQAQSRKIVTTANAQWLRPFRCAPWAIWNETTGADVTVTVHGTAPGALPENCDVWLDVEYQQSDGLGKIVTTTRANVLATCASVASDSSTWAGPSPVSPPSLTGLIAWYDATITSSLNLTGANVGSINDQSGAGNHIVPISFTAQYDAVGFNGHPGVMFSAALARGYVRNPFAMGTGNTLTIFGVWYVNSLSGDYCRMMSYTAAAASHDYNNNGSWLFARNSNLSETFFARNTINSIQPYGYATPHRIIVTIRSDGTTVFYVDGVPLPTASPLAAAWVSGGVLGIGTSSLDSPAGNRFDGAMGECGVATGYSDPATVAGLDAYLAAKWSLTGGSYTPFKLVATLNSPQPGRPGLIHVRPKIGKASATFYLDPQIELTPASAAPSATHRSSRYAYEGTETTETSIVRSGGTAHSRKIVTTANSQWLRPYRAEPYAVWNDTVGADVTITVYGNAASLPNTDDIWAEVEYLNTTHGTIVSTTKANVLATGAAGTSDSSSWAGGTTAFKLVATLNSPQPGQPGLINVRVRAAKPSSTFYIDPTPELTTPEPSDVPAWVPEGAKIHIDFLGGTPQGRAWLDGTGEVGVGTLFGQDPNTADAYGTTQPYSLTYLHADGYDRTRTALLGAARDLVMSGATLAYTVKLGSVGYSFVAVSLDGDAYIIVEAGVSDFSVQGSSSPGNLLVSTSPGSLNALAVNVIAMTLVSDRLDIALNGGTAQSDVIGVDEALDTYPLASCLFEMNQGVTHTFLQSITIYDPLPSTAGLSELSEP